MREDIKKKEDYIKTLEERVIDLDKDVKEKTEEIEALESSIISLRKEIKNSQTQLDQANKDKNNLQEITQEKENQLQKLVEEKAKLEGDLQRQIIEEKELNQQLKIVKEELRQKDEKNQELVKELTKNKEEVAKIVAELDSSKDRVKELEKKLQSNSGQADQEAITNLNSKIEELEKQIKGLKKKIVDNEEAASKDQEGLLEINAELEQEVKELKANQSDQEKKQVESLREKIKQLENQLKNTDEKAGQGKSNQAYSSLGIVALAVAEDLISPDRDGEEGIFEERRKARKNLQYLVEETSPEAKQAYQLLNKNNIIDECIKKLEEKIWNHLNESAKKDEEDPSSQELIAELAKRGHDKGTEIYKIYWILRAIIREFAKSHLKWKKEFNVYPYIQQVAFADVDWRNGDVKTEIIDMYFNFNAPENFGNDEWQIYYTLGHELSHCLLLMGEFKGLVPRFQNDHTKPHWDGFLIGNDSTLAYVISCLPSEKQQKLKEFSDPSLPKKSINPSLHFFSSYLDPDWETNKKVFEKKIEERSDALKEWNYTWRTLDKLIYDSIGEKNPKNWEIYEELKKHWYITKFWWKDEQRTKYGITIHFNKETMPHYIQELINSEFDVDNGWERIKSVINVDEKNVSSRSLLPKLLESNVCGCVFEKSDQLKQQANIEQPVKQG